MIKNIYKGISAYRGSFKLINQLNLWKYFAIPMIISLLIAALIGFSVWGFSDNLGNFIAKAWIWETGAETFRTISNIIGGITIIAIGLILYKHIVMALSAPFMSPVSAKIEAHLIGETYHIKKTSNIGLLWRGIRINFRNLLMELLLSVPILILSFIPVINIFSSVLLLVVQSYYAGFGSMDYTLERHFNLRDSVRFVRKNRGIAIGNGIVFMAMLIVPIIGLILVLPLSVTASTSETVRLLKASKRISSSETFQKKLHEN